jgi:hypothetical protein
MYVRILKIALVVTAQFGVLIAAHAQAARGTSTTSGQATIVGSNGPAAILALPPSTNGIRQTQSANTSSGSGTSAKVMPVRRPGTTGE